MKADGVIDELTILAAENCPQEMRDAQDVAWGEPLIARENRPELECVCQCQRPKRNFAAIEDHPVCVRIKSMVLKGYNFIVEGRQYLVYWGRCECGRVHWGVFE